MIAYRVWCSSGAQRFMASMAFEKRSRAEIAMAHIRKMPQAHYEIVAEEVHENDSTLIVIKGDDFPGLEST